MRFPQPAYSQEEDITPLSFSLVLESINGTGTGLGSLTQDIVQQITAFVAVGDTATGKEVMRHCVPQY